MKKQTRSSVQHPLVPRSFKKAMPVLSAIVVLLMSSAYSFSQDKVSLNAIQKDSSAAVWHTLKTSGGVTVSYQWVDCGPAEYVHFRIANASADKVTVAWLFRQSNNGSEIPLIADLARLSYTLEAGASVQGACGSEHFKLGVFVREEGVMKRMTDIELADLTITKP